MMDTCGARHPRAGTGGERAVRQGRHLRPSRSLRGGRADANVGYARRGAVRLAQPATAAVELRLHAGDPTRTTAATSCSTSPERAHLSTIRSSGRLRDQRPLHRRKREWTKRSASRHGLADNPANERTPEEEQASRRLAGSRAAARSRSTTWTSTSASGGFRRVSTAAYMRSCLFDTEVKYRPTPQSMDELSPSSAAHKNAKILRRILRQGLLPHLRRYRTC